MYNVIININNRKKSYDLFGYDKGLAYCWSVLKDVFTLLTQMTVEYLTKFTNSSYENILV